MTGMGQMKDYTLRAIRERTARITEIQQLLNQGPGEDKEERKRLMLRIANEVGAHVPLERNYQFSVDFLNATLQNIRVALQIQMTMNACISAKWSCVFAAAAAVLSLLATAVAVASIL
jgi:hypothetical protein